MGWRSVLTWHLVSRHTQNLDILEDDDQQPMEIQQLRDQQLAQTIDFKKTHIDPAPFQLVERTSLYKVCGVGGGWYGVGGNMEEEVGSWQLVVNERVRVGMQYVEIPSPQVHSLFSILALSHAYVTSIGRLVGVVTLTDVSIPLVLSHYLIHHHILVSI